MVTKPVARVQPPQLAELTRAECLALLAAHNLGRVVVAVGGDALPVVRPVTYAFDATSQSVVFRSAEGAKLHRLLGSRRACFEIDSLDQARGEGWSVIIQGTAEPVVQPAELRQLENLAFDSWAPGDRQHWIRIRARVVTGRRLSRRQSSRPRSRA